MKDVYRLAEKNIEISTLHERVHIQCAEYRFSGTPDFSVEITQEDIDREKEESAREEENEGVAIRPYSEPYLETLAVYRQIAEKMPDCDTILFHGSCVAVDGVGYLFAAGSGTGKSTHTRLWRELLGEHAVMVNDDKPLIRVNAGGATVFGTPWDGKHHLSTNTAVPLKAVCFLSRAKENRIEPAAVTQSFPLLLQQVYRPADPAALEKTLRLIDLLCRSVKLYRLGCNMSIEAAELSYHTMKDD